MAARAMAAAVDTSKPNPIVNPVSRAWNPYLMRLTRAKNAAETKTGGEKKP